MTATAVPAGSSEPRADRVLRISGLQQEGALTRCTTDGGDIMVPRVPATYLRSGDDIRVGSLDSPATEYLAIQNSPRRKARQLYFGRIGYVTQPRADKRDEYFVRAEVPESGLGIRALHLPSTVVRDYFYCFAQASGGAGGLTLYELLRASPKASPADLRLSYRIRRIELNTMNAGTSELQRAERAFNLLAHPDLRSCYDALLQDAAAPALFPYGGFGQCVVAGDLSQDGRTFFAHRLLSYLPDQRQRHFRAPLRRVDYLNGYAVYRDSRRKAEVFLDPALLPVGWDPTWNQWKHLAGAKIGIAGTFVASGKYRQLAGEWHLIRWETALPSRVRVTVPADVQKSLSGAQRAYQRFGQYHDAMEQIRARLAREPLDEQELASLCRSLGVPSDFDVAQLCWKPDYDSYFYQQLKKRSQNVYFLRDQFIFQLPRAIVIEIPQLGHATYIFTKPPDVREFVHKYAITSRDDIRKNRGNVAQDLGFIGRVMHGSSRRRWLRDLLSHVGEAVDYALLIVATERIGSKAG